MASKVIVVENDQHVLHNEITLVRLLRRLEKSAATGDDWTPSRALPKQEVWLRGKKMQQNVKYARTLVKNIEADEYDASSNNLDDFKTRIDRLESFWKEIDQSCKPDSHRPDPILPTIPIPVPVSTADEAEPQPETPATPSSHSESADKLTELRTHGLSINPPPVDPDEISPTLITSTLPSLLPSNPAENESAATSAFSRGFSSSTTVRKLGGTQTSMALQEELSAQLELMAQQLKRNAVHFSESLVKDKAVVEDAQVKLEANHDVMMKERVRLRDHRGKSIGTTCMTLGIVVLVLVVFMLMVSVIRFS